MSQVQQLSIMAALLGVFGELMDSYPDHRVSVLEPAIRATILEAFTTDFTRTGIEQFVAIQIEAFNENVPPWA